MTHQQWYFFSIILINDFLRGFGNSPIWRKPQKCEKKILPGKRFPCLQELAPSQWAAEKFPRSKFQGGTARRDAIFGCWFYKSSWGLFFSPCLENYLDIVHPKCCWSLTGTMSLGAFSAKAMLKNCSGFWPSSWIYDSWSQELGRTRSANSKNSSDSRDINLVNGDEWICMDMFHVDFFMWIRMDAIGPEFYAPWIPSGNQTCLAGNRTID